MNKCGYEIIKEISKHFECKSVFEIGSKIYDKRYNFRNVFKARQYFGVDFQDGIGVDRIVNIHNFHTNKKFDTILCTAMLEHDEYPHQTLGIMREHLANDGKVIILTPFYMHIHGYPNDYYRYTPEGMRVLLETWFDNVQTFGIGPEHIPHTIIGLVNIKVQDYVIEMFNRRWKHDNGNMYYYAKEWLPPKIIRLIKYLMYKRFY